MNRSINSLRRRAMLMLLAGMAILGGQTRFATAQDISKSVDYGGVETTSAVANSTNSSEIDTYASAVIIDYTLWYDGYWVAAEADLYDNGNFVDYNVDDSGLASAKTRLSDPINLGHQYDAVATSALCYWIDNGDGSASEDCSTVYQLDLYGVLGIPSISSISPNGGTIGKSGTITINGQNLIDPFSKKATPAITGSGVTFSVNGTPSSSQVVLNYSIASNATAGNQSLTLQNRFGTSSGTSFTVGYPPAVISNISPSVWTAGGTYNVTITGQNFGTAPTLSISSPGVTLQPGYTANPNGQSIQATVVIAANTPTESVNISVQPGYAGQGFYCNCQGQPPNGTNTASTQANLPAPTINLNGTTNSPVAGQAISLSVSAPNGLTISSQTWTFGNSNDAVANYIVSYSGSTPSSACYVPVVASSGTGICNGSAFSLTNTTVGPFYFIVPGATETITVAARYKMADGSVSDPVSSSPQSFSVQGPKFNLKATMPTDGTGVQIYSWNNFEWVGPWGVTSKTGGFTGIHLTSNATGFPPAPDNPGLSTNALMTWVQLISNSQIESLESSGNVPEPATMGLDSGFPYDLDDTTDDHPAVQLNNEGEMWRTFTATMYLMWDPGLPSGCQVAYDDSVLNPATSTYTFVSHPSQCTQSIPVPLSAVTWHYSGCALNTLANQTEPDQSKSTWLLSTSNGCPKQTLGTPAPAQFPTWTTVAN